MLAVLFEVAVATLFAVFVVHGLKRFNARRLLYAVLLLGFLMWLQEHFAMNVLAPGLYHYEGFVVWLWDVPLCIPLAWIMVSYVSFFVAVKTGNLLIGASAGCCFDLLLEPLAFLWGLWIWRLDALTLVGYWNAPLTNAFGWLLWCYLGARILNETLKLKLP